MNFKLYFFCFLIISVNLYLVYGNIDLYIRYQDPDICVFIQYPTWLLVLHSFFISYVGIFLVVKIIQKESKIRDAILYNIMVLFLGDILREVVTI